MNDWYEDYDIEPSEVDCILDEAKDKIADLILNTAKAKVDEVLTRAQRLEVENEEKNKCIYKLSCRNTDLAKQVKELTAEIEKKRTSLKEFPFEVGDSVWNVVSICAEDLPCPKCGGTGRIKIKHEGSGLNAECPVCQGNLYAKKPKMCVLWQRYEVRKDTVKAILYNKDEGFTAGMLQGARFAQATLIFAESDRDKAEELAKKLTAESREQAEKKLRGEE